MPTLPESETPPSDEVEHDMNVALEAGELGAFAKVHRPLSCVLHCSWGLRDQPADHRAGSLIVEEVLHCLILCAE